MVSNHIIHCRSPLKRLSSHVNIDFLVFIYKAISDMKVKWKVCLLLHLRTTLLEQLDENIYDIPLIDCSFVLQNSPYPILTDKCYQ